MTKQYCENCNRIVEVLIENNKEPECIVCRFAIDLELNEEHQRAVDEANYYHNQDGGN